MNRNYVKHTLLALVMMILLLTAACSGSTNSNSSNRSEGAETGSAELGPAAEQTTEPAAGEQNETKIVSTVKGDVEIPTNPKRIVALYYHHLLLALDTEVIGANLTWWGGSPYLAQLETGKIVDVGGPPSLEAIAALEPDLIIMNNNNNDDYEQLAKIAPSVLIPYDPNRNVYEETEMIAEIVGKQDQSKQLLERFNEKAAVERARLADIADESTTAAIIRIEGNGGQFSVFGENYGRGGWSIFEGLKFKNTDKIQQELEAQDLGLIQQLSLELLPDYIADADYIFVSNEGEGIELIKDEPIWQGIPAVQQGNVIELEGKKYFYFDPVSIEGQLTELTDLILQLHQ